MKGILFFLIYFIPLFLSAQGVFFIHEDLVLNEGEACNLIRVKSGVVNQTNIEQNIVWERITNELPCDWVSTVFDGYITFPPSQDSYHFNLNPGDTMILDVEFYPWLWEGEGTVELAVHLEDDPETGDTLRYTALASSCSGSEPCVSSALDISVYDFKVLPNPFSNSFSISNIQYPITLKVYNLAGKEVYSNAVYQGEIVDCSNLVQGIYFAVLEHESELMHKILLKSH